MCIRSAQDRARGELEHELQPLEAGVVALRPAPSLEHGAAPAADAGVARAGPRHRLRRREQPRARKSAERSWRKELLIFGLA